MSNAFHEDIRYVYDKLLLHPLFIINAYRKTEFIALYNSLNAQIGSYDEFVESINRLTGYFCDGHTNIEMPYSNGDKALNIPCYWHNGKLLLKTDYMGVGVESEIVEIESKAIDEIVFLMADRIPHENLFLVKSRMINYPYKNYHLFSKMSLSFLFGDKEEYVISFVDNGVRTDRTLRLEFYNGFLDFTDDDFISYEIKGNTAVLHLDSCICNETYKSILCELADACNKNDISTLVLDLSKNMGGNSAVIDEFIKHTNIGEYRRYEMIDYSSGKAEYITKRTEFVKNNRYPNYFNCDIVCRVSCDTFSSARTFAVTLKDNGIAKAVIGAPTGGKPNSFGMPKKYKTPNCSIPFRVSRCLFLRPDNDGDEKISLFPDDTLF